MSVTLILLPTVLALGLTAAAGGTGVVGAITSAAGGQTATLGVRTRMKDRGLLIAALEGLGASRLVNDEDSVTAVVDGITLTMTVDAEGVWQAHLEGPGGAELDEAAAVDLVTRIDAEYAAKVQGAIAQRIRQQADGSGLELVSEETDEDDTITMRLTVKDGA